MKKSDFLENTTHGESDFPIQYYHLDEDHPQYVMALHWHPEYEIVRILSGELQLHLNGIPYRLTPGDAALIEGGMLHSGEPQRCVYECIVFDTGMLRCPQNDRASLHILPFTAGKMRAACFLPHEEAASCPSLSSLFSLLRDRPAYYELGVQSALYGLLAELYRAGQIRPAERTRSDRRRDNVIRLLNWIELHYREPVTLAELARQSGFNQKYLCHLFKEFTGQTPITYLNGLRIENACRDMAARSLGATEAAFENGFNDLSYFSRTFRRYKGISPTAWRKSRAGEKENNSVSSVG